MKRISATHAKNNFGGLLDDVAALGGVEVEKHGRVVAVMLSPRALQALRRTGCMQTQEESWGGTHMIPPERARAARIMNVASDFDEQ